MSYTGKAEVITPASPAAQCLACEMCGKDCRDWPAGLFSVDREDGTFTGDFVSCPECAPESAAATPAMVRDGVVFLYYDWFWWQPAAKLEGTNG